MELRQLRYFCAVATHRSFNKASAKLYIAQPALSRQIHSLEGELGVQLLMRTSRGVEVTEAGRRLQEMGEYVLRYVAEIKPSLAHAAAEPAGHVVLGLPPSLAFLLAPRLVTEARQRFPLLTLRIIEGLSVFLTEWLELGRVDLAVLTDYGPLPGIERFEIAEEDMVFAGAPKLLSPSSDRMALEEIVNYPLMATHGFKALLDPWLAARHIEPRFDMELDSIPIVREMMMRGLYCSVVPYSMVHDDVEAGHLVVKRFSQPSISRRIVGAFSSRRPMTRSMQAVFDLVRNEIERLPGCVALPIADASTVA